MSEGSSLVDPADYGATFEGNAPVWVDYFEVVFCFAVYNEIGIILLKEYFLGY